MTEDEAFIQLHLPCIKNATIKRYDLEQLTKNISELRIDCNHTTTSRNITVYEVSAAEWYSKVVAIVLTFHVDEFLIQTFFASFFVGKRKYSNLSINIMFYFVVQCNTYCR